MRKVLSISGLAVLTIAAIFVSVSHAFFDEIEALQSELQVWQTTNAADFTEVLAQLDDITGPIFRDVQETDWFNPYVSSLAEWGIVSGYKDANGRLTGEFKPANNVTVAEALKMAMESAKTDRSACGLAPVNHAQAQGHWAREYVSCAEQRNVRLIVQGIDLNKKATRAEILTIVHDVFGDRTIPIFSSFSDTAGHKYEQDIAYASLSGIVRGDTDASGAEKGTFRPDDSINRAETSKVIYERLKVSVRNGGSI